MGLRHVLGFLAVSFLLVSSGTLVAAGDIFSYQDYIDEGIRSFKSHEDRAAFQCFNKAHALVPAAEEPLEYINLLKRLYDGRLEDLTGRKIDADRARAIGDALDHQGQPSAASSASASKGAASSAAAVLRAPAKAGKTPEIITIDEIIKADPAKPTIHVDLGAAVIIEGRDVKRFLEVQPGFLQVTADGRNRLRVEAKRWGSVFLHVWDERGRTTIYVEVTIPRSPQITEVSQASAPLERARPWHMKYAMDYGSYYTRPEGGHFRQGSSNLQQTFGIDGDTPYGVADASLTATGFDPVKQLPTYTMGLTNIPFKYTNYLGVRLFDASRDLSPLTLSNARLRGVFADMRMLENNIGVSVSHGSELSSSFGVLPQLIVPTKDSFIDAVAVSLFPLNPDHMVKFNYAVGSGADRDPGLTKRVYSVEGRKKIGPAELNAELARNDRTTAKIAGVAWANGLFRQRLNFRDINKDYSGVLAYASNQGEIGGTWTTTFSNDLFSSDTYLDVFQDRLYPNPDSPQALNYDANGHTGIALGDVYRLDTTLRRNATPGEISPRTYTSGDARLSRNFRMWGGRMGSVYVLGGSQWNRYQLTPSSDYDRYALTAGIQAPFTRSLSGFMNYEYSWLFENAADRPFHPAVLNTGLSYNRDITDHLAGNLGVTYRNELNVKGSNSFLAGEDSVAGSAGLVYTPQKDVNVFCDTRLRSVWSQVPNGLSYNDMDVRVGMRMVWGLGISWDPQGSVSGFVFKDRDGNGVFSPDIGGVAGDEGLPGVRVKVGDRETVTDERGWYSLAVKGKKALVAPVMESLPSGFVFSTPAFSKVEIRQGRCARVDFGVTTQSGIYGVAFVDKNGNGLPDPDDTFIGRVKIMLDGKVAQVTDSRGAYFFKGVSDGKHVLTIDMATLPAEFIPTVKVKNDVTVAEGTTYVFHIPLKLKSK